MHTTHKSVLGVDFFLQWLTDSGTDAVSLKGNYHKFLCVL